MKNAIIIAFLSIVLCPVLVNTGVFSYYSFDIKSFTEKFCINKAEPELRCNGKCKLNSIIISTTPPNESKKNQVGTIKIPFFTASIFAYSLRQAATSSIEQTMPSQVFVLSETILEISTPPPQ